MDFWKLVCSGSLKLTRSHSKFSPRSVCGISQLVAMGEINLPAVIPKLPCSFEELQDMLIQKYPILATEEGLGLEFCFHFYLQQKSLRWYQRKLSMFNH